MKQTDERTKDEITRLIVTITGDDLRYLIKEAADELRDRLAAEIRHLTKTTTEEDLA